MSNELRTTRECICKVNSNFMKEKNWKNKISFSIDIGELVYKNRVYDGLYISALHKEVTYLDEDIILDMLFHPKNGEGYYGLKLREVEDDNIKEFLVKEIMNIYIDGILK